METSSKNLTDVPGRGKDSIWPPSNRRTPEAVVMTATNLSSDNPVCLKDQEKENIRLSCWIQFISGLTKDMLRLNFFPCNFCSLSGTAVHHLLMPSFLCLGPALPFCLCRQSQFRSCLLKLLAAVAWLVTLAASLASSLVPFGYFSYQYRNACIPISFPHIAFSELFETHHLFHPLPPLHKLHVSIHIAYV